MRVGWSIWTAAVLIVLVGGGLASDLAPNRVSDFGPAPPSFFHWLGTDRLGRDVAQRSIGALLFTMRQSLAILLLSAAAGILLAVASALAYGRLVDQAIVLAAESVRAFPTLLLALFLAKLGAPPSILLSTYFWVPVWRMLRVALVAQKNQPYARAAELAGLSPVQVLLTRVLPNVLPSALPYFAGLLAEMISSQCAIEFLGFGPAIDQPSLGGLLLEALNLGLTAPWVWLPSLAAILAVVWGTAEASRRYREGLEWVTLG